MTRTSEFIDLTVDDTGGYITRGSNARTGEPTATVRVKRGVNPRGNPGKHDWPSAMFCLVARIGAHGFPTGPGARERLKEQIEYSFEDLGFNSPGTTRCGEVADEIFEAYSRLFSDE